MAVSKPTTTRFAELYLTDGTVKVNLLSANNGHEGIGIENVAFSRPQRDLQSIFSQHYSDIDEVYNIKVVGKTQDGAIAALRSLETILIQAENYFDANVETGLVWLVSRASDETSPRYAVVKTGKVSEYPDIYQQPFNTVTRHCVMDNIDVGITRRVWQSNPPLAPKNLTIKTASTSTTVNALDNRFTEDMIKQVFVNRSSTWTSYPFPSGMPTGAGAPLYPSPPAAGDIFYIGFTTRVAGSVSSPSSIYFNIVTPAANITSAVWEYWSGAAWTALPDVFDSTNGFTTSGTVSWSQTQVDTNWVANSVNGVSALWLRRRITAVGGGPISPWANFINTPKDYIEINAADVKGDIPALADVTITGVGKTSDPYSTPSVNFLTTIRMGLRSTSRGSTFMPWLFPQNPLIAPTLGNYTTVTDWKVSPRGTVYRITPGTQYEGLVQFRAYGFTIDGVTALGADFFGTYRVYLRALCTTNLSDTHLMRFALYDFTTNSRPQPIKYGPDVEVKTRNNVNYIPELYDMGQVTLGARDFASSSEKAGNYAIEIQGRTNAAVPSPIDVAGIFLLPVDEWSGYFEQPSFFWAGQDIALIGSASHPKRSIRSVYLNAGKVVSGYIPNSSGPLILQPGKTQRLYFLFEFDGGNITVAKDTVDRYYMNNYSHPVQVTMKYQERFLGLRGNG